MASINKGFIPVALTGGFRKGGTTLGKIYKGYDLIYDTVPGVGPYVPTNAEVVAWAAATGITTDALIEAVDDFVSGCKTDSIWSLLDVVYPFVTDSTVEATIKDQFKYNLVDTTTFELAYTGSSTVGYEGYTNGGSGAMIGTGFVPSVEADQDDFSMGIYTTSGNPGVDVIDFGSGVSTNYSYLVAGRNSGGNINQVFAAVAANLNIGLNGSSIFTGLLHGNVNWTAIVRTLYQRGTSIGSIGGSYQGGLSQRELAIGCFWYGNSIINSTSKTYQFAHIGKFFDATQAANLNTRVLALQAAVDTIYGTSREVV